MNINIQAIHFEISDRLTDFINKKAARLARRFADISTFDANLTLIKPETAMNKEVVLKVTVPNMGEMIAKKRADTFEEAFDTAVEALDHQFEKLKNRK